MSGAARGAGVAFAGLVTLAGLVVPAPAVRAADGAASPAPLALSIDGCPELDEARLRALVAIEIATVGANGSKGDARVRLSCVGERVSIDVAAGPTWPAARAELNLAESAEATRLRVLALAITELVSLAWSAPAAPAPPPVTPGDVARADVVVRPAAPEGPRPFEVQVGTSARRMGRPAAWLVGVDVGARRAVWDHVALALDLRGETGDATPPVADVAWRQLVVTGAVAFTAARAGWGVHASPGWSLGIARLSARPTASDARGGALTGVWSGPSLALGARRALGRAAFVSLDVAGGYVTRRVVGLRDGQSPIFEIEGSWALAGLGVGATF